MYASATGAGAATGAGDATEVVEVRRRAAMGDKVERSMIADDERCLAYELRDCMK